RGAQGNIRSLFPSSPYLSCFFPLCSIHSAFARYALRQSLRRRAFCSHPFAPSGRGKGGARTKGIPCRNFMPPRIRGWMHAPACSESEALVGTGGQRTTGSARGKGGNV